MKCLYCKQRRVSVQETVVAVITAFGHALAVRTWFHCYGCHSSFAINVAAPKE